MKIDRNNYEIYFLDYLEGRLTTEQTAALLLFVEENPDLKELLEGEELINLSADDTIMFYPKSALKRNTNSEDDSGLNDNKVSKNKALGSASGINSGNYEEFIIRFYENDLTDSEQSELAYFLKDSPTFITEFELYATTLLKRDTGIIYPHKNRLKRNIIPRTGVKSIIAIIAVAASVLIFSTLFLKYLYQPPQQDVGKKLAGSLNGNSKTEKIISVKENSAGIKPAPISPSDAAGQSTRSSILKNPASEKSTSLQKGSNPVSKHPKSSTPERSTFEVPASLITREAPLLATTRVTAPRTIARRTDFDGITSIAYYDPDPDALPLNTGGKTIGGRLGSTLAQGISQTAGTIAREPEVGRLLRGKISLSDIASIGLAGFNLITDSKLSISREYDPDGNMKGYALKDGNKRLTRLP